MEAAENSEILMPTDEDLEGSIVQVDTFKLEKYLQHIKDHLSRHDKELLVPVWWDSVRSEIDQISILTTKLEHVQLDMNTIRDTVFQSMPPDESLKTTVDELKFLAAEIEGVKITMRRVELHQAIDRTVLLQLRELQRGFRDLKAQIPHGLQTQQKALSDVMDSVLYRISSMEGNLDSTSAQVDRSADKLLKRINEVEAKVKAELFGSNGEASNVDHGEVISPIPLLIDAVSEIKGNQHRPSIDSSSGVNAKSRFVSTMDYIAAMSSVREKIDHLEKQTRELSKFKGVEQAGQLLDLFLFTKFKNFRQAYFKKWWGTVQKIKAKEEDLTSTAVNTLVACMHALYRRLSRQSLKRQFELWVENIARLQHGDTMRSRMRSIAQYWRSRAHPDRRRYFHRWHRAAILLRGQHMASLSDVEKTAGTP